MSKPSKFRVIIVGGGIGGVVLANSLEHAGVDFVIVEKGERLDPHQGASIGILPNGARILDQLGCYSDIEDLTVSMESSATRDADGEVIGQTSDALKLMQHRTGYSVVFLDRQKLLSVLSKHLRNKDKVLLNTSIKRIEQTSSKVTAYCKDGTPIEGDIIVGADGAYSIVRHEMWRHADETGRGEMFSNDKEAMSSEYKCMFGISTNQAGMSPGQTDRTYAKDISTLSYVGKEGRIFWFVFTKMDKTYYPPNIPKFSQEETDALVDKIGSLPIRENGTVTLKHLYDTRVTANLVAIEEATYEHWSLDRSVSLGDSVHKMTPNLGAGASSAIEDAADLSNSIVKLASSSAKPNLKSIGDAFAQYQKSRSGRVTRATLTSNALTRVQALQGTKEYLLTHYVAPMMGDSSADMFSSFVIGASSINHLPIPTKSTKGTMPFNPRQGWGFEESKRRRAMFAFPLLVLAVFCLSSSSHQYQPTSGGWFSWLGQRGESLWPRISSFVFSDVAYGLCLLESTRLHNKGTLSQLSILWGLALQRFGANVIVPLYLFLLYVQTPIESFRASDSRLTDTSYTTTAGPLIILFGLLPKVLDLGIVQEYQSPVWQQMLRLQPLIISAWQFLLARTIIRGSIQQDRLWAIRRDVPWLRTSAGLLMAASAASWWGSVRAMVQSGHAMLPHDSVYSAISTIWWLGLVWADFKHAEMVRSSWFKAILLCAATLACIGPSGLLAVGWLVREEILLHRRHKSAITTSG